MIFGEVIPQRRTLLLVEDNLADAKLAMKVLRETDDHDVVHVSDGEQALMYLKQSEILDHRTPDLIILDLNLPRRCGIDVLREIKADAKFMHIPVVVLTSSDSESDILESFRAHANAYVKKSVDLYEFMEVLRTFKKFWLHSAKLPRAVN